MSRKTADYLDLAKAHQMPIYAQPPLVVSHGRGSLLWDTDGREYLDYSGGIGVNVLGHAHPAVVAAIAAQAARTIHTSNGLHHPGAIEMATRLGTLCALHKVFLCNSGCEAVEAALKLARRVFFDRGQPRSKFVAVHGGFHGRTLGALSVTGQPTYQEGFSPLLQSVQFVPYNNVTALQEALDAQTAAFIVEPVLGNGGVVAPDPGYLAAARRLCDDVGALLIVDEVQTGIGRTGHWLAHSSEQLQPDIVCLAKAVGGGLPLGAILANEAHSAAFAQGVHGSTFGGSPLACAAGLATMQEISQKNLLAHATTLGQTFRGMLLDLQKRRPDILEVRGRGLLIGLRYRSPAKPLAIRCRTLGLLSTLAGSHVLRFFPPLNTTTKELERCVDILALANS